MMYGQSGGSKDKQYPTYIFPDGRDPNIDDMYKYYSEVWNKFSLFISVYFHDFYYKNHSWILILGWPAKVEPSLQLYPWRQLLGRGSF